MTIGVFIEAQQTLLEKLHVAEVATREVEGVLRTYASSLMYLCNVN